MADIEDRLLSCSHAKQTEWPSSGRSSWPRTTTKVSATVTVQTNLKIRAISIAVLVAVSQLLDLFYALSPAGLPSLTMRCWPHSAHPRYLLQTLQAAPGLPRQSISPRPMDPQLASEGSTRITPGSLQPNSKRRAKGKHTSRSWWPEFLFLKWGNSRRDWSHDLNHNTYLSYICIHNTLNEYTNIISNVYIYMSYIMYSLCSISV